jgi:glycosyltransferase involved in cell wall biosynthesis
MVFAGDFWRGSTEYGLAQGFRKLGLAVQQVEIRRYFADFGSELSARVLNRGLKPFAVKAFRAAAIEVARTVGADIFLSIKGTFLDAETLRVLKDLNIATAVFYPDYYFNYPGVSLDSFDYYDLIITTKSFQVPWLKERFGSNKIAYVPHGYSSGVHWPIASGGDETDYVFDLQHVGGHSSYKHAWFEELHARLPEASLRLIGPRWEGKFKSRTSTVLDALYDCAYSLSLQAARINVAVMMGPHEPTGWMDNVSTRSFEIPACKGFMLHIDNDEIREFFKAGEEIDVFSSGDELADKARFYLARPALRQRMILRAYERCVPAYSYDARCTEILKVFAARGLLGA